jgi:hypothetical protein
MATMNYAGGKGAQGTYHKIISLMPPHEIYIEPFYGGGSIMQLKRPAKLNIGIDRDRTAVEKAGPPAESRDTAVQGRASRRCQCPACWATPDSDPAAPKSESRRQPALDSADPDENAMTARADAPDSARGYLTPDSALESSSAETGERRRAADSASPAGSAETGEPAVPLIRTFTTPAVPASGPGRLDPASNYEAGPFFRFQEGDGIEWLEYHLDFLQAFKRFSYPGAALIYCDPPYMRGTCKSRCRYKYDLSDVDHRRLLRVLQELNALPDPPMLMISGYDSPLYREMLLHRPDWHHTEFQAMTRGGKQATEHLWFNFAPPVELHDYRYQGRNWRDRERMKRRQVTWTNRLKKMAPYEREALLNAIRETTSTTIPLQNEIK